MIGDHEWRVLIRMPFSAQLAHHSAGSKKSFDRGGSERNHYPWLDNGDLFLEIGEAGLHFRRGWGAIPGAAARHIGPTLEDIRDVNVRALESHRCNYLCEKLASFPNKGFAARIFIRSWCFANEHQIGLGIADTKNRLRAGASEMRTFETRGDACAD